MRSFRRSAKVPYRVTPHIAEELDSDDLSLDELLECLLHGVSEVIEDYPGDPRGASCLILTWRPDGSPIHTVIGYSGERLTLVTVYRPDRDRGRWSNDFRRRIQ